MIDIVGHSAGLLVSIALTPQVYKSWKTKSTKDISVLWTLLMITGLALWLVYGFGISSYPIIVFGTVELILSASLLVLKLRYK